MLGEGSKKTRRELYAMGVMEGNVLSPVLETGLSASPLGFQMPNEKSRHLVVCLRHQDFLGGQP